ncbi:MAG: LysR family transcriptional regulator [Polyangiaceae bacterium]
MDLLSQMATFVRVVETGGLSAAARPLGLSVAAVSRQISSLEAEVGAALLLRTTRRLNVTEEGRRYYDHCLRVLREVEAAQASVRGAPGVEGLLIVTAPVTFGLARVSPHLGALLAKHRGLSVDLRVEDRIVDLVSEGADVAIRTGIHGVSASSSLVARRLTSYRRVVVASPRYVKRRGEPRAPSALSKHDAIVHLATNGRTPSWRFSRDGEEVEVRVSGTIASNAPYAMRDAALAGVGVSIVPEWLVADDIAAHRLRILLPDWELAPVVVTGVFRAEMRGAARVRALLDHLVDVYAVEDARRG